MVVYMYIFVGLVTRSDSSWTSRCRRKKRCTTSVDEPTADVEDLQHRKVYIYIYKSNFGKYDDVIFSVLVFYGGYFVLIMMC
jgi:hypothetical protein